MGVENANTKL